MRAEVGGVRQMASEAQTTRFDLTVAITDEGAGAGWRRGVQPGPV